MNQDDNFSEFGRSFGKSSDFQRFNLAVVGPTGAGKSTLINAMFGDKVAETGTGKPVTRGVTLHVNPAGTLGLYDFEGIEAGRATKKLVSNLESYFAKNQQGSVENFIHGIWYCIHSSSRRIDDANEEVIRELAKLRVPVLVVLTQVPARDGRVDPRVIEFSKSIQALGLPIIDKPFYVNAERDSFADVPVHGLSKLLAATLEVAPEGVRSALIAAQRVDADRKRRLAQAIVAAAASSAAAGLAPLPGADALAIAPIQGVMMKAVAQIFQIDVAAATLTASMTTLATTYAGRAAFTALLKLVPGAGNMAAAAVAAAFTTGVGAAWSEICRGIYTGRIDASVLEHGQQLGELLLEMMKEHFRSSTPSRAS